MIESMTGYGSSEKYGLKVEMRSFNHRFLDLNIKAPPFFLKHETAIRNLIKNAFHRGHIDIYVTLTPENTYNVRINKEFARGLIQAVSELKDEFHLMGEIDFAAILSFKEAVVTEMSEAPEAAVEEVVIEAMEKLKGMRQKEGQILLGEITRHLDTIVSALTRIKELSAGAIDRSLQRIRDKLMELMEASQVDQSRLLQEAALMADKYDISEEIQRIGSHLKQFRQNLLDNDKIGRKLDFILQELNREVNTITSKTDLYSINVVAVDLKAELEKLREQAQNIQ